MACVQDQINSDAVVGDFQLRRGATDNLLLAQKFTAGITGGVCSAQIDLNKTGSPTGNIWAEIYSNNAGVPGSQINGDSDVFDVSTLDGTHAFKTFGWSSNYPQINSGVDYWLVLNGNYTISSTNCAQWGVNNNSSFVNFFGFDGTSWAQKLTWAGRFSVSVDSTITTTSTSTTTSTTTTSTSTSTTTTSTSTSSSTSTSTTITTTSTSTSSTSTSTTSTSSSTSTSTSSSSSTSTTATSTTVTLPYHFATGEKEKTEELRFGIYHGDS